jgi:HlyD family secretion protein
VAASFQAPVLFVIAQDLSRMRVFADIDEADVGRLREGMTAEVTVDAFPGESFKGTVSQVRYSRRAWRAWSPTPRSSRSRTPS